MDYELMKYSIDNLAPDNVVEYLRKSRSDDPNMDVEEVLERHESILDDWAVNNLGSKIPSNNVYREVVSGETISERPQVQEVLKRIESPMIKAILVVEPQRLTRGDLEDIGRIMKLIKHTNTLIITPTKIYNLHDKYDYEIFERELKRGNEYLEYTKMILNRGRLKSVSEGNYIGSIAPYGYTKTFVKVGKKNCPTLEIDPQAAEAVRLIFDLYVNQGMGAYRICMELEKLKFKPPKGDRWSPNTIPDILINQHYIGKVVWNWRKTQTIVENSELIQTRPRQKAGDYQVYDGRHEAIISEELFNAAQTIIGRHYRAKANTKVRNPLAGIVYCSCGRSMSLRTYKNADGSTRSEPRLLCDGQSFCHSASITYPEMLSKVKEILANNIADFRIKLNNNEGEQLAVHRKMISRLEKRKEELSLQELKLWNEKAQNRGTENEMPEYVFAQLKDKLKVEQEEVEQALISAYNSMPKPVNYQDRIFRFQKALDLLNDDSVSAEKQNLAIKACIDRITYTRPAPIRLTRKYCKEHNLDSSILKTGGNWYCEPAKLDIKLMV